MLMMDGRRRRRLSVIIVTIIIVVAAVVVRRRRSTLGAVGRIVDGGSPRRRWDDVIVSLSISLPLWYAFLPDLVGDGEDACPSSS